MEIAVKNTDCKPKGRVMKSMGNPNWRFGVVANIAKYHIDNNGNEYRGTQAFTGGTKVYLAGKSWDNESKEISVIGRNRFGRIVLERIPINCLENIRTQQIFKPRVLEIIEHLEAMEGWIWWARTSIDRKETKEFVEAWQKRR